MKGRDENSSIDSLDHAFLTDQGDVDAVSPSLTNTKHLSPTNFSCDSGLFSSDTQLYDDCAADVSMSSSAGALSSDTMASRRGLHRSAPVSRHVSRESHESQSPTQGHYNNESYDSAIDVNSTNQAAQIPRAAPRKAKIKSDSSAPLSKPVQRMPTVHSGVELRTQTLQHIQSESGIADLKNVRSVPKRGSGDSNLGSSLGSSLGSVVESSDEFSEIHTRRKPETNILRKSESGAKLYIDESLLHGAMYIDASPGAVNFAQTDPLDRPQSYHGHIAHTKKGSHSASPPSVRHSWGGQLEQTSSKRSSAKFSLSPSHSLDELNEEHEDLSRDISQSTSALAQSTESNRKSQHSSRPEPRSQPAIKQPLQDSSERKPSPKLRSTKKPHTVDATPAARTATSIKDLKSKSMDAFPPELLPSDESQPIRHSPRHVDKTMLRKHLKGMTATGGDWFPSKMRKTLAGTPNQQVLQVVSPDVHVRDHLASGGAASDNRHASKASVHASPPQKSLSAAATPVDSSKQARAASLVRQMALEKSASDPRVSRSMRPHQPPSYSEAISRRQQVYDAEIEEQRKKSAMARRMHEQSQRLYAQEQRSAKDAYYSEPERTSRDTLTERRQDRTSHAKPLPSYEQAVKRAEELKEQRQGLPPAYNKQQQQQQQQWSVSPASGGRDPALSGQSRRRSKSRERGQRLSDTRLESRRKRKANLSRSKSDSSEHLNKLSNVKQTYSSSTDTDDDRPVVLRTRRMGKSLSKERLNHDTASPRSASKSSERPKSVDYGRMLKQLQEQEPSLDAGDSGSEPAIRTRRKSWTVKNRDWHKELAEQYTGGKAAPSSAGREKRHTQPIFTYRGGSVPQGQSESHDADTEDSEKPRRRWVPPVHPSKDLIMCNGTADGSKQQQQQRAKESSAAAHVHRSASHATALKPKSNYVPTHVLLEAQQQAEVRDGEHAFSAHLQYRHSDSPPTSPSDHDDSDVDIDDGRKLSWSVSKLRGLYDASKNSGGVQSSDAVEDSRSATPRPAPRAVNAAKPVAQQRYQPRQKDCIIITKEHTNPHAEKQYL